MKTLLLACFAALGFPVSLLAQDPIPRRLENVSVRNEVQLALDKALGWLARQQRPDGSWSNAQAPALTALPLRAFLGQPAPSPETRAVPARALEFLRLKAQPDGALSTTAIATFDTALSLSAFIQARIPEDQPLIARALDFLSKQQAPDGGFASGQSGAPSDLFTTLLVLEALRVHRALHPDLEPPRIDWKAAVAFVTGCQVSSGDPESTGAFASAPGAPGVTGASTCAGLLCLACADLPRDDARFAAALAWLRRHPKLEEHPGAGRARYYSWLHLLAKSLALARESTIKLPDGRELDWPRELALKLINTQSSAGTWENAAAEGLEADPILTTSSAILALEIVFREL